MQKIELIALDLDGTLLNDNKKISPESMRVMEKIISKGIYIVPTSGRMSNDDIVQKKLEPIGIRYFIGENGGIIKDCVKQKNLRVVSMDLFESIDLIKELERYQIFTYFVSNEKIYYSTKNITNFLLNTFAEFFEVSGVNEESLIDIIMEKNIIPENIGTLLNSPGDVKKIKRLKNKYKKIIIIFPIFP